MDNSLFNVLLDNFLKFDFLIFIIAAATLFVYILCLKRARRLYEKMHLTIFVPEDGGLKIAGDELKITREYDVVALHRSQTRTYNLFATLIVVFPLMGILGTVISLLPLVGLLGSADVTGNFFGALTSTFWGLVFAIAFRIADGFLSGRIEDNDSTVALYLDRAGRQGEGSGR